MIEGMDLKLQGPKDGNLHCPECDRHLVGGAALYKHLREDHGFEYRRAFSTVGGVICFTKHQLVESEEE